MIHRVAIINSFIFHRIYVRGKMGRTAMQSFQTLPFLFKISVLFLAYAGHWSAVIRILNVSRKFSMCIIFSTGYIKIYNIEFSKEYIIHQHAFVQSTIQYNSSKT